MNRFVLTALATLFLSACETTDYPGFKRIEGSVHYRLISLGDQERKVSPESYISMEVKVFSGSGVPMAQKRMKRVAFENTTWPIRIKALVSETFQGDSLEVRGEVGELGVNGWFAPVHLGADTERIALIISIQEVLTATEVLQLRAEERVEADRELMELSFYQKAVDSLGFEPQDLDNGIFFRSLKKGSGTRPRSGDELVVRYKTWLADGQLIDDTFQGQPLEYIVGKPDQVLLGFSKAMARMTEGETALFILPSDQAFGEKGSSSGIVPPFAALVYEAQLVKIRR
ncbi:MAG: FKBP-type peptidyl-prolyl cis-trans isomerase [Cryomorphaceae bacterium]